MVYAMDIQLIISELIENRIISPASIQITRLNGGTTSEVYLLKAETSKFIIKINQEPIIKAEAQFLLTYKELPILPQLVHVHPEFKYLIYRYIEGTTTYIKNNKPKMLKTLVENLINHYKPAPENAKWGWPDYPVDSWETFQKHEIIAAERKIADRLSPADHQLIYELAALGEMKTRKYLLHGDCGVHNFIFQNRELTGVIDTTPIIGDPLYDLVYAFFSSPDELTKETIETAAEQLIFNREIEPAYLYSQILIGLYLRMETCLYHHPEDFPAYLKAFEYWKEILNTFETIHT